MVYFINFRMLIFTTLILAFTSCQTTDPAIEKSKQSSPALRAKINKLSPLQYKVTQEGATEKPFQNAYWNHFEAGIYVDVVTGDPLFSSLDKFDSRSGWPAFRAPIRKNNLRLIKQSYLIFFSETEILATRSGSHLGHLFYDGPDPGKKHYCINSAALRFIPVEKMNKEGYGGLLLLFKR